VVEYHPHRSLADLRRKLVRRLAHIGSTLSGVRASGKPRAVQYDPQFQLCVALRLPSHQQPYIGHLGC
jgi:hypothetical protein